MADTKLSIINQALTAAGEDPLTVLTPGSVMANACIESYDAYVAEELENGSWKFATKTVDLTILTAKADTPMQHQWQLPAEVLAPLAVMRSGKVIDGEYYEIEGRVVRCIFDADISVKYVYRADEGVWPARFKRIIVQRLEALLLRVTERHNEADRRDGDTMVKTAIARHSDSRQRINRPIGDGSLIEARRGGRRRRSV